MRGEGPELVLQAWEALKVLEQSPGNTGQSSPSQSHVGPSPGHSTFCFSGQACAMWAGPPLAPEGAQAAGPQAAPLQSRGPGAAFKLAGREGGARAGGGGEPLCPVGWALSQPGELLCPGRVRCVLAGPAALIKSLRDKAGRGSFPWGPLRALGDLEAPQDVPSTLLPRPEPVQCPSLPQGGGQGCG